MKWIVMACMFLSVSLAAGSVKHDIDLQYKRWSRAAVESDVEAILKILAPDYTLQTYTGKVIVLKDYEASLQKRREAKKATDAYETKISSIQVHEDSADVISDETSFKDTIDPVTNKPLKIIHIHRYLDTWIKLGRVWRLHSTVTQQESTKIIAI